MIQPRKEILLNAVAATTVSRGVGVDNAAHLSIMIFASGITSGNGVFSVDVTNDPSIGWVRYNRLTSNLVGTNAQTDNRVASATLSANSTAILFFPDGDTFNYIRANVAVTTDGVYSAVLYLN